MNKVSPPLTRQKVFELISHSSRYGNLGAFIGAGFSKAVLDNKLALSWGELLEKAAEELEVEYKNIKKEGISYPDIASQICKLHCQNTQKSYDESSTELKNEISKLTSWYPDQDQRKKFSPYLNQLNPSWVMTTNYDMVIESLLTGTSIPLGPNDSLIAPNGIVPVFHLHGVRSKPDEIIITQEDYIGLFRPTEYRQIKLALMLKESTTLIIGYGLGDVNVLTALDWSKNVFKNELGNYPNHIIQVVRKDQPKDEPYTDKDGIIIIESDSLEAFFDDFISMHKKCLIQEEKNKKALRELAKDLDNPDESMIEKFIDDTDYREEVLDILSKFSNDLISGFVTFLNKCIDETWARSKPNRAFQGYADNLSLILDILTNFSINQFPPALFETTAYALQRVGYYVGNEIGQSYAAKDVWDNRKHDLSDDLVSELRNFAKQHDYHFIENLCNEIK